MNIIITGPKHCGKSTIISKIINRFSGSISGFITEFDNRESNERELLIRSIDSSLSCCAVKWNKGIPNASPKVFDEIASKLILLESDLIIIDELGKFEKDCKELANSVLSAFSSDTNVLASVRLDAVGWMQELKYRNDIILINVSDENRDVLPAYILEIL